MVDFPKTYEEARAQVIAQLNCLESLTDKATSADDWLQLNARILYQVLQVLQIGLLQPVLTYERPIYTVKDLSLTSAREEKDLGISGNYLAYSTDGDTSNISIKFDQRSNDSITLSNFNHLYGTFQSVYLTNTAQEGRSIKFFIGQQASASALQQTGGTSYDMTAITKTITYSITTTSTLHFTGSIAQYAKEDENLTGLIANKVRITGISIQSSQALDYYLMFWKKDTFSNTDLEQDSFVGIIELDLATFGFQVGSSGQYYLSIEDTLLDYWDDDNTKELHVSLFNNDATTKAQGSSGAVVVTFKYEVRA